MSPILLKFLVLFIFCKLICCEDSCEAPIVKISNGKLLGNFHGNYYSFKGIPYAQPPIGNLRFESPVKFSNSWKGIRVAQTAASTCTRLEVYVEPPNTDRFTGSEDCLYLNVYTPNLKPEELLPVIVFIHQGGFMYGSGDEQKEDILMKYNKVILVNFNYRLGPMGFLSTGDSEISGNMGLKDQRLVLQWVHDNIESFGGNKSKVLMAGFSAGAASVELQLLKPGIEKLVNSAVSFSGSALNPWVIVNNPKENAINLGFHLNCTIFSEIKKCLQSKSGEEIVRSVNKLFVYTNNPFRIFGPVVENSYNKDYFIADHPRKLIKSGKIASIPWLASYGAQDGAISSSEFLKYKDNGELQLEDLNKRFDELIPTILFYKETMSLEDQIKFTKKIKENYYLEDEIDEETFGNLTNLYTDILVKDTMLESLMLHKNNGNSPVYSYIYDNPASFGLGNLYSGRTDIKFGTVHGDDVFLIFNYPPRDKYKFRDDEINISNNFVKMLDVFASTGRLLFGTEAFPENTGDSTNIKRIRITKNGTKIEEINFDLLLKQ